VSARGDVLPQTCDDCKDDHSSYAYRRENHDADGQVTCTCWSNQNRDGKSEIYGKISTHQIFSAEYFYVVVRGTK